MSHLVMQGSYVNDWPGYDLSPHSRRDFRFRSTFHNTNKPFRTSSAFLPKWLNFKSENDRRAPQKKKSQESNTKIEQQSKVHEINEDRDGQLSTRSNEANSSFKMHGRTEEQKKKTNPKELKQGHEYREKRDRIMLVKEQKKDVLRIIRRFYLPSFFCIGLGTVFILCSSVHSIGAGTLFWELHKAFRIIGASVTGVGVIMLLATVGLANRRLEKLKKSGVIIERNHLIHPDFLKEPDIRNSKQSLTKSIDAESQPIQEHRRVPTDLYKEENSSLLSPSPYCIPTDSPRRSGAEKLHINRKQTNNAKDDEVGFYFYNSQNTSRRYTTKANGGDSCNFQKAMSDNPFDDEVFVRSEIKSRQFSADVKENSWHRNGPSESSFGANDDVFYEVSEMRRNGVGFGFTGKNAGLDRVERNKVTNISINGTGIQEPRKGIKDVQTDVTDDCIQIPQREVNDVTMNITDRSFRTTDDVSSDALMTSNIDFASACYSSFKNLKASSKRSFAFA